MFFILIEVALPKICCIKNPRVTCGSCSNPKPSESTTPPAVARVRASDLNICRKPRDVIEELWFSSIDGCLKPIYWVAFSEKTSGVLICFHIQSNTVDLSYLLVFHIVSKRFHHNHNGFNPKPSLATLRFRLPILGSRPNVHSDGLRRTQKKTVLHRL